MYVPPTPSSKPTQNQTSLHPVKNSRLALFSRQRRLFLCSLPPQPLLPCRGPLQRQLACRLLLQLPLLVGGELALGFRNIDKEHHDEQRDAAGRDAKPERVLVAAGEALVRLRVGLDDVGEAEAEGDAELEDRVDEAAAEALARARQLRRDEDGGDVEGDVDADGREDHGGEDKGPVVASDGDQRQQERRADPAAVREDEQCPARDQVQHEAADGVEGEPADDHRDEPGHDLHGRCPHDVLEVLRAVEEVNAQDAVIEEESDRQCGHAFDGEDVGRQKRHLGDPTFHVDCCPEEEKAEDQQRGYVWSLPAVGRVGAFGDGKDDEHESRDDQRCAYPVHLDAVLPLLRPVRLDSKVGRDGRDCSERGANPEVEAPVDELADDAGAQNAEEEANDSARTIQAENEVLPGTRTVGRPEKHNARRQECCGAEALQRSAEVQHERVDGEAGNERPDSKPDKAGDVHDEATVHVSQSAKDQQRGRYDQ